MATISRDLMKVLTTPAKAASSLDWRKRAGGAILTLNVQRDRIDLAVAHHPSEGRPSHILEPLELGKKGRVIPEQSRQRLAEIVKQQRVCAFVVSWPIQQDNGKMGYAAGRTLWTIEELLKDPKSNVFSANRPVCLWDGIRTEQSETDIWGRNPDFARTTTKTIHMASQEQYHADEGIVVSQVWDDFMKANWPGIYYNSEPSQEEQEDQERDEYVFLGDSHLEEKYATAQMAA